MPAHKTKSFPTEEHSNEEKDASICSSFIRLSLRADGPCPDRHRMDTLLAVFHAPVAGLRSRERPQFQADLLIHQRLPRAERRYANITSSQSQFQGTVTLTSLVGDRISLKQVFQQNAGPWILVAVKKPGALYEVENGATLSSYTIGTPVRINTISNTVTHVTQVYINGSLRETRTGGQNPLYDKFGTYRTASGRGPVAATWSNIGFWRK